MIDHSETGGVLSFKVRVVPRASRSEIAGEHDGALRVRLAAAPVEGAANEELIRLLAKAFDVSRNSVTIASGHKSKLKVVSIADGSVQLLENLARG